MQSVANKFKAFKFCLNFSKQLMFIARQNGAQVQKFFSGRRKRLKIQIKYLEILDEAIVKIEESTAAKATNKASI
jgi:hypothetical protein